MPEVTVADGVRVTVAAMALTELTVNAPAAPVMAVLVTPPEDPPGNDVEPVAAPMTTVTVNPVVVMPPANAPALQGEELMVKAAQRDHGPSKEQEGEKSVKPERDEIQGTSSRGMRATSGELTICAPQRGAIHVRGAGALECLSHEVDGAGHVRRTGKRRGSRG